MIPKTTVIEVVTHIQLAQEEIILLENRIADLETAVREEKQRYTSLAEVVPVGIFHTDTLGNYCYVNERWCQLAGLSSESAMGRGWLQGLYPDDREQVAVEWDECVRGKKSFQREYRWQNANGVVTWVSAQATTQRNANEQVIGYTGTIADITKLKQTEDELISLNQQLEQRVAEQTALLRTTIDQLQVELIQREIIEDILIEANEKLQTLSQTDGLTQVSNRRHFDQRLQQEWRLAQRRKYPLSLLLFDVDYFKYYNDHYGHQKGDECLVQLAQASQQMVSRPSDLVARYGGEEFAILLPDTDQEGAVIIAQRLQAKIATLAIPHQCSGVSDIVTVSIGIATIVPSREMSAETLVAQADQALYAAKKAGRDRYMVF